MVSKGIMAAAVIVVILIIGGGIYMTQQPPASTPPKAEEASIREAMMTYYDAFDRHSLEDFVTCYTDDAEVDIVGYFEMKGREEIKSFYIEEFKNYPSSKIENLNINIMSVSGDTAAVKSTYNVSAILPNLITEEIDLVKVDGIWKIAKSVETFSDS